MQALASYSELGLGHVTCTQNYSCTVMYTCILHVRMVAKLTDHTVIVHIHAYKCTLFITCLF